MFLHNDLVTPFFGKTVQRKELAGPGNVNMPLLGPDTHSINIHPKVNAVVGNFITLIC